MHITGNSRNLPAKKSGRDLPPLNAFATASQGVRGCADAPPPWQTLRIPRKRISWLHISTCAHAEDLLAAHPKPCILRNPRRGQKNVPVTRYCTTRFARICYDDFPFLQGLILRFKNGTGTGLRGMQYLNFPV